MNELGIPFKVSQSQTVKHAVCSGNVNYRIGVSPWPIFSAVGCQDTAKDTKQDDNSKIDAGFQWIFHNPHY